MRSVKNKVFLLSGRFPNELNLHVSYLFVYEIKGEIHE